MRSLQLIILLFLMLPFTTMGQETLSFDQFMEWVRNNHPIAKQANINLEFGEREVQMARGGFDPLLYGEYDQKQFKDIQYFDKREAGILIPTVAGVELKGIYEQNTGVFLNSEKSVPSEGLISAGASVNVGQGLFIDKRRAALRQAKIYRDATVAERRQFLNDLYLDANDAYWNWSASYENRNVLEEALRLAEFRFEGVRESFILGDLPAIDTVEAYTQVLNRQYRLQSAEIAFFNASQQLNTFLWGEDDTPINLLEGIVPQNISQGMDFEFNADYLRTLIPEHPELKLADYDLASLEIERRWKAEQLKPVVKINYNFLTSTAGQIGLSPFFENNYKWGFTIYSPLFLRKERGGLGLTKAKIGFKQNDRDLKFLRLQTKLESEINNFLTLQNQYIVYSANLLGLDRLLQGELTRFRIGESSLFLVNAREISFVEAKLILNDLEAKRKTAYAKMLNAAGLGFEN